MKRVRTDSPVSPSTGAPVDSVLAAVARVLEAGPGRPAGKGAYHDDTLAALKAVLLTVNPADSYQRFADNAWAAVAPFNHDAIEEVPIALGAFRYGDGDFLRTLRAAVLYGRDADSIAGMACGLVGAMHGLAAIPAELRSASDHANRRDFARLAAKFHQTVLEIMQKDQDRWNQRVAATS